MLIEKTFIEIHLDQEVKTKDATPLRGYFGNLYKNRSEFHGHKGDKFLYRHPLIQYKYVDGKFFVMGLQEGAYLLKSMKELDFIELWNKRYKIVKWNLTSKTLEFGLAGKYYTYEFITPWIGLNEVNFKNYLNIQGKQDQEDKLFRKVLVGNILSLSKSLEYTANGEIIVEPKIWKNEVIRMKGKVNLFSFKGSFQSDFLIPSGWGIGKFSSRGYGIVFSKNGGNDCG